MINLGNNFNILSINLALRITLLREKELTWWDCFISLAKRMEKALNFKKSILKSTLFTTKDFYKEVKYKELTEVYRRI